MGPEDFDYGDEFDDEINFTEIDQIDEDGQYFFNWDEEDLDEIIEEGY